MVKRSKEEIFVIQDDRVFFIKDLVVDILPVKERDHLKYESLTRRPDIAWLSNDRYFIKESLDEGDHFTRYTVPLHQFTKGLGDQRKNYYIGVNDKIDELLGRPFFLLEESKKREENLNIKISKLQSDINSLHRKLSTLNSKVSSTTHSTFWERIKFAFSNRTEF